MHIFQHCGNWWFGAWASVATVMSMHPYLSRCLWGNTLRFKQKRLVICSGLFQLHFLEQTFLYSTLIHISLQSVAERDPPPQKKKKKKKKKDRSALVQVMTWRWAGDKPGITWASGDKIYCNWCIPSLKEWTFMILDTCSKYILSNVFFFWH